MAYTMDAPHFGRKMPTKGKPYSLSVRDHKMLRGIIAKRPVSDITCMSPAEEQARRKESYAQVGHGGARGGPYDLIRPTPEEAAEAARREALMAAGREERKRGMARTASIAESMKAAADKFWGRK